MSATRITALLGSFLLITTAAKGQFPEDALRLSQASLSVGARAAGMGSAFTGVANDFSALYWNPAGLGQIRQYEVSVGMDHLRFSNDSRFFGQSTSFSNSATSINNAGLVYPVPTRRGSLTLAFGYNRSANFTTALSFNGFNPVSSIIPTLYDQDENQDLAWKLFLEDTTGYSPIQKNVNQQGEVLENDGVNSWSIAGALEIAPKFYVGATATLVSGSYTYHRKFIEEDTRGIYTTPPFDFQQLILDNTIEWDLSGYGLKLGMLYNVADHARLGFTIKIPSHFDVRERFRSDGTSVFKTPDKNGQSEYSASVDGRSEYDVVTPFVFGGGASIKVGDLLLSGEAEYADWTQMEFKNPTPNIAGLTRLNSDIKRLFRSTVNLRGGAEYILPGSDLRLRGGFAYNPSPYDGDPSSFAQKYITGGVGFAVQSSIYIDIAYVYGYWDTFHVNYNSTSRTDESVRTSNLLFTVSYRF